MARAGVDDILEVRQVDFAQRPQQHLRTQPGPAAELQVMALQLAPFLVAAAGHSRVPVFDGSVDRIVGLLYVKDLLKVPAGEEARLDRGRLLREAYALLGLISFLTAGEDACRAWSIVRGTTASRAAGVIHSDFERGFIRAEVVPYAELIDAGSLATCRQRGTLRLEGRDYVVQDGDVILFRHSG